MNFNENYLKELCTFFRTADTEFRDRVCHECGWSIATYYRKVQPGKMLSPVELKAIREISKDLAKNLLQIAANAGT